MIKLISLLLKIPSNISSVNLKAILSCFARISHLSRKMEREIVVNCECRKWMRKTVWNALKFLFFFRSFLYLQIIEKVRNCGHFWSCNSQKFFFYILLFFCSCTFSQQSKTRTSPLQLSRFERVCCCSRCRLCEAIYFDNFVA